MTKEPLYRVKFIQYDQIYTLYAKYISEETIVGFIELEELLFSPSPSSLVLDTTEEKLKSEFKNVQRCYLPMHTVLRIDEVSGVSDIKIESVKDSEKIIKVFPASGFASKTTSNNDEK